MATVHSILTNFTAGELSPRLYGRIDVAKYQNGARDLTNFVVLPQGGIRKRAGSKFIASVRMPQGLTSARLVEFTFSTSQSYILEFGEFYIRFFKDQGQIYNLSADITAINLGTATTITLAASGLVVQDRITIAGVKGTTQLNNREFYVGAVATGNVITLKEVTAFGTIVDVDSTNYNAHTGGGVAQRIYEIATTYNGQTVQELTFTQSADTLFIFHRDWPIKLLTRTSHINWTLTTGVVEEGPFLDMNENQGITVSVDVGAGTGVMTFSAGVLEASHLGSLWRIWEYGNGATFGYATWAPGAVVIVANGSFWEYKGNVYYVTGGGGAEMSSTAAYPNHTEGTAEIFYGKGGEVCTMRFEHSGYAVVQVTNVINTQQAWVNVVKNRVPYTAYGPRSSFQWQEGSWSDKRGYPTVGTFHEQRLVSAGTEHQPSTIWGSEINAYLKYQDGDKDDKAYHYTISSDQVDAVKFMASTKRLALMATSAEYIVQATSASEAITPTNIKVSRETSYGTSNVRPVRAGPAILFAQRAGLNTNPARRLREFVYNFQTDSYLAPDLTILSDHITHPGLVDGAFTATPDMQVWYARADGVVACMTYERDQQVVGWHKHFLGGGGKAVRMASIPGENADELWMIVERSIQGLSDTPLRYIEVMTHGLFESQPIEEAWFLDCALAYDGRGNLVKWSQDLSQWAKLAMLVPEPAFVLNAIDAPDGSKTADLVTFPAWVGLGSLSQFFQNLNPVTLAGGATYTLSFYYNDLGVPNQAFSVLINSNLGVAHTQTTVAPPGDGKWRRYEKTFTYAVGTITSSSLRFGPSVNAPYPSISVAIWGVQLIPGDTPGPYYKTDAGIVAGGGAINSVSGLWHLNGQTISALCDGEAQHELLITNGRMALPHPCTVVIAGYRYSSLLKTLHIEAGAQSGTAQGRIGRVYEIIARLQDSVGGKFGMDENGKLDPIEYRHGVDPLSTIIPMFNGDMVLPFDGDWDRDRYVTIQHDEPLPFTLTALMISQRVTG